MSTLFKVSWVTAEPYAGGLDVVDAARRNREGEDEFTLGVIGDGMSDAMLQACV